MGILTKKANIQTQRIDLGFNKPAGSDPKLTVFHHRKKSLKKTSLNYTSKQNSMINKNSSGQLNKDLQKVGGFADHGINLTMQTKTVRTFSRKADSGGPQAINTTFGDRSAGEDAFTLIPE